MPHATRGGPSAQAARSAWPGIAGTIPATLGPVRTVWVHRDIDAPAERVWDLLTNVDRWPDWGPTVRRAELDGNSFEAGAVGTVTTSVGVSLPFQITEFEAGRRWTWAVAGVPATDHTVVALGEMRSRAGFGVPWIAAPYLTVCAVALRRLESMATENGGGQVHGTVK